MTGDIIRLDYQQNQAVRRLVHGCCNYQDGNCLLLDDGEECICPQSITCSLVCRWFRAAVLPADEGLCAALLHRRERKKCVLCGGWFVPKSNRGKYCPECAKEEQRRNCASGITISVMVDCRYDFFLKVIVDTDYEGEAGTVHRQTCFGNGVRIPTVWWSESELNPETAHKETPLGIASRRAFLQVCTQRFQTHSRRATGAYCTQNIH